MRVVVHMRHLFKTLSNFRGIIIQYFLGTGNDVMDLIRTAITLRLILSIYSVDYLLTLIITIIRMHTGNYIINMARLEYIEFAVSAKNASILTLS